MCRIATSRAALGFSQHPKHFTEIFVLGFPGSSVQNFTCGWCFVSRQMNFKRPHYAVPLRIISTGHVCDVVSCRRVSILSAVAEGNNFRLHFGHFKQVMVEAMSYNFHFNHQHARKRFCDSISGVIC